MSNPAYNAILSALPGTMKELAARTGITGQPLWDAVHTLRKAGMVKRHPLQPGEKERVFSLSDAAAAVPETDDPVPDDVQTGEKKQRRRPVILFWLPDWPPQDPNRRMVWQIVWSTERRAQNEFKRLQKHLGHEANWELVKMTATEARRLRLRGYDLKEVQEREANLREKASS